MFTPQTFPLALLMMITSAICWGSWANTYKGVKNYRFELFYWDYAIGIFLMALILGHTMGSTSHDATSLVNNIHSASTSNVVYALVGGAIFNLANLLLVAAIDMAGLAVAFPISIGIALVVGTVLSYALQPKGNAALAGAGRDLCALVAVILDGKAYGSLARGRKIRLAQERDRLHRFGRAHGTVGSLPDARDDLEPGTLGPYSAVIFLTLGALLSCFIWNFYFMKHPLVGEPVSFSGFFRGPVSGHMLGILGGLIWGTGTVFNMVAASLTGVAISYAVGQSAPMVAAAVGSFRLEGIRRSRQPRQNVSGRNVRLLLPGDPFHRQGQRIRVLPF